MAQASKKILGIDFDDFNFSRPVEKFEKQSYKKLTFSIFLTCLFLSSFLTLGLMLKDKASYVYKDSKSQKMAISNGVKSISPEEFKGILAHLSAISSAYDKKVYYIQSAIIEAKNFDKEKTYSITNAKELGQSLVAYKKNISDTMLKISKIKEAADLGVYISKSDADFFTESLALYRSQLFGNNQELEANMLVLLYSNYEANNNYYNKSKVYENIAKMSYDMKSEFVQHDLPLENPL